jgi:O-antigen biosynthesis protein WbqV
VDLARKLVLLSGLRPDVDIPIVFSEPRPGEKMYEEISSMEENTAPTPHAQIRVFTGSHRPGESLTQALEELRAAQQAREAGGVVMCLKELVPDYNPSSLVLRQAFRTPVFRTAASVSA